MRVGTGMAALVLGVAAAIAAVVETGCSDDAADDGLSARHSTTTTTTSGDGGDPNDPSNPNNVGPEVQAFQALQPDLLKKCGAGCHDAGTYKPPPPTFLEGPDVYKSIKAHPGIVTRDVYASTLLTKGPHAGPAVSSDPEFEKKVIAWLEAEAVAIRSIPLPTTPALTVANGPNDVDLSPACAAGLTGVHLKFDAALIGDMLSLSNVVLVAPAGQDVHILAPRFVRVLAAAGEDGKTDVADPADSFSNADQTVPGGKETPLAPGAVVFSNDAWRPFDLTKDKIRIEVTKLEPGKISVLAGAATCKDVAGFAAKVLPSMRGEAGGFNLKCSNAQCHGEAAIGNMNLSGADNGLICQQVLSKINQANIGQSLIVTKPTSATHGGGQLTDADGWKAVFVNNAGVFF